MNHTIDAAREILTDGGFTIRGISATADGSGQIQDAFAFEDNTVIGFVIVYETAAALLSNWRTASDGLMLEHTELLGAAGPKAWNTYLVLLAADEAGFGEALALGQVEEDLEGMRKIARAGIAGPTAARGALLPLLPFRAAPVLEPVDMPAEIRERASDLDPEVVRAFLSRADPALVLQIVEDNA
jgi:hypothetical protein